MSQFIRIEELDRVVLKDGSRGTVIDYPGDDYFIFEPDGATSPEDLRDMLISDVKEVIYHSGNR